MLHSLNEIAVFVVLISHSLSPCLAYVLPKRELTRNLSVPPQSKSENLVRNFALAGALVTALLTPDPALATSKTAAQVQIDAVPPKSILIDIADLPLIGQIVSGTYARLDTGATKAVGGALGGESSSSITIRSPEDKVKAIQDIASTGHLEFDIGGKLETHVDIEFATPKAGQLEVLVESPLIPKLPVKNALTETTKTSVIRGGKKSAWSAVTNLGDGSVLYTNSKTGASQKEKPADIY
mmetsp:Transcript_18658/g.40612  ORF Transcript_18658/g.40612 Transcript_18658/m.40612 type:complete len:239 (+) Transcript_18658:205-921(+)